MTSASFRGTASKHPIAVLFIIFLCWKSLLLALVLSSPGVGYDTSTALLSSLKEEIPLQTQVPHSPLSRWQNLVRWDAIYFTHIADSGHVYEQEWAFGMGLSNTIIALRHATHVVIKADSSLTSATIGTWLSHLSHWFSVVLLWYISHLVADHDSAASLSIANTAAALQIFSPAGIFLSAPCSESLFAFLNMLGYYLYLNSVTLSQNHKILSSSCGFLLAGISLGFGTMVRSNGILSGLPFLYDAFTTFFDMIQSGLTLGRLMQLGSLVAGGMILGSGTIIPQYIAYREYCTNLGSDIARPWCQATFPMIFTWVQSHYWNVGLFRYWTLSNVPLFLLAMPTLWLLAISSIEQFQRENTSHARSLARRLAVPQLVLAVAALTSYHVQIITRLSSGYPIWCIWVAQKLKNNDKPGKIVAYWAIVYALVQAGLYASFLPPA